MKRFNSSKKMNVLLIIRGLYIGGAELVVATLCKKLDKDLFNLSVCYIEFNGPIGDDLTKAGHRVFGLDGNRRVISKYFKFFKLAKAVRKERINILHSHGTAALVEASLCKLIVPGVRVIHTFHFGNYPHMERGRFLLEKLFWRIPDRLIAVGNEQRSAIRRAFGIPGSRISTVWNGTENNAMSIDSGLLNQFLGQEKVIIGSLSTLTSQKGISYLLRVAFQLRERGHRFLVLVVGDGPLRRELEEKCEQLGLVETVKFLRWVSDAAAKVLPIFDIFVQSSLWEAMSMVVLEAMAAGKPVVITDVGENRHIIDHGKNGWLVAPGDVSDMVGALERLICDKDLRARLGLEAKKKVAQEFTAERMAKSYQSVYQRCLSYDF